MLHLNAVVEHRRASEDQIVLTGLVVLLGILAAIEPHQIHDASTIGEMGYDTLTARSHVESLKAQDAPHDLHEWHVARELADFIYLAAVHILIGIILQQVAESLNTEFFFQQLLAVGAYARQIHDVLL